MANMWTCDCTAVNKPRDRVCSLCGQERPAAPALPVSTKTTCPIDRAALNSGVCLRGQGYPMPEVCPFACPMCRKPLEWSGACYACHGTITGQREDWSFPGDRYELERGHWVKVAAGPRPACSRVENRAGAGDLVRIFAAGAGVAPVEEEVPF